MENNSELLGWKRNQQFEKRFFTLGSRLSGWHKPQSKCLALSANGLVVPQTGEECLVPRDYLCEHQSCYAKEGFERIFPFTYKDVVQTMVCNTTGGWQNCQMGIVSGWLCSWSSTSIMFRFPTSSYVWQLVKRYNNHRKLQSILVQFILLTSRNWK